MKAVMNKYMVETKNLSKRFGENLAVDKLSITIPPGEVFGLLGPNGAGKTTTIRMLSALIKQTQGEAFVAGYKIGENDYEIRKNVGILTESPGLYDRLSAERNLAFFAKLYEVDNISTQVERYLRMLGLWERRLEQVGTFSKGMRQKLAIARALLHEPKVLFLDEPTSGLDPEAARLVREFITELRQEGRTIVICTHNLDEADRLCDRIAVFNARLLALDTPKNLRNQLYGRTVVFHLASADEKYAKKIGVHEFVRSVQIMENKLVVNLDDPEAQNPALIRELVALGAEIRFVGELRHSLEDVYLRLIKAQEEK
jgi:ABC-2 type transport system ATP-binding protein